MGASLVYLEKPNKDIQFDEGENDNLKFVAAGMQGWRINMVSAPALVKRPHSKWLINCVSRRTLILRSLSSTPRSRYLVSSTAMEAGKLRTTQRGTTMNT